MQTFPKAPARLLRLSLLTAAVALAGCNSDLTAPAQDSLAPASAAFDHFGNSLIKVSKGEVKRFSFRLNPAEDNTLEIGKHSLDIPAGAICDLHLSGYGVWLWDKKCKSQRDSVTITAVLTSTDAGPRVDFEPALRFSPSKTVVLSLALQNASKLDLGKLTIIKYCPLSLVASCYDESQYDSSLVTTVGHNEMYRRIKHFSGYMVAE